MSDAHKSHGELFKLVGASPSGLREGLRVLLEDMRPLLGLILIDAISDDEGPQPAVAANAERALREIAGGSAYGSGDEGINVQLDGRNEVHWRLFQVYAPLSVSATAWYAADPLGAPALTFRDTNFSPVVFLDPAEGDRLSARLPVGVSLVPAGASTRSSYRSFSFLGCIRRSCGLGYRRKP